MPRVAVTEGAREQDASLDASSTGARRCAARRFEPNGTPQGETRPGVERPPASRGDATCAGALGDGGGSILDTIGRHSPTVPVTCAR